MTDHRRSVPWRRFLLWAVAAVIFFGSAGAILVGTLATLCAMSPGTDMADANVLIRVGPLYALGGMLGLALTFWIRRRLRG